MPLLAWSGNPDLVAPGRSNESVVQGVDVMPTLVDLFGTRPPRQTMSGTSFAAQLTSARTRSASFFNHLPGYFKNQGREAVPTTTLRRQDGWKLTYRYETRSFFLANLTSNPRETVNYRDRRRFVMRAMTARLLQILAGSKPGLPLLNDRSKALTLALPRGTRYYRDGRVRSVRTSSVLRVEPDSEMPVVVKPVR